MDTRTKTVLICEDDEGIIDVTTIVLQEKGYKVIPLLDCQKVYEYVDTHKPDIILLDLWMPDINGEEVTRTLKSNDHTKHIPIIIISANKDTEKIAKNAGADTFLCKPFDIEELEQTVERYLR